MYNQLNERIQIISYTIGKIYGTHVLVTLTYHVSFTKSSVNR